MANIDMKAVLADLERDAAADARTPRTKLVCTLGPASRSVPMLEKLLRAGMNVARFNFSHGTHEYHQETLDSLRQAMHNTGILCAVMLDTKGPEIRTGFLKDGKPVKLTKGQEITVTTDYDIKGDSNTISMSYKKLPVDVKPGHVILCADGTISLTVLSCDPEAGTVRCMCENTAMLGERKNCNLPGIVVDLPTLTEKDKEDILGWGVPNDIDMIALSFVRKGSDLVTVKKLLGQHAKRIMLMSKVENQEGIVNFDEILRETDAFMVARGDLGMEIPVEKIFLAQKMMIYKCNLAGKPVVTATQMLESMIKSPRPTRAEATDVANAVLDGTDCVMLSGESAAGAYPEVAVKIMARICVEAESSLDNDAVFKEMIKAAPLPMSPLESLASSAVRPTENPDMGGLRKGSNPDKFGEMNNFASRFDQAMSLNMSENPQANAFFKPQSPQLRYQQEPKKSLQPQPVLMQETSYNVAQSPERKSSHPLPGSQHYNKQQQHHQQNQHQQGYNAQHNQHHNQNPRSHHQGQQRNFDQQGGGGQQQQQYYQGMPQQPQMGGPFFDPNYMQPQMQANPYYGMNAFQPQMYPYGMDPNMAQSPNQFSKMPANPYGGANRMNQQMPDMNPMGGMQQMGGMNQYYMNNNPYMNNFYPMGGFQQNQPGNFQPGNFPNQNPQQQNRGGQKPTSKNPAPKLDIKHVLANLIENCKDQNGSRLIQQHFEKSNETEKEQLFQQILPHAFNLMTDVFGNYVIQKILELGPIDQKLRLFEAMQGNVFQLSQHTYGCRVVQRILEELRSNGLVQDQILEELSQNISLLIEDQNGNHVIQKSFETMPAEKVQFIIKEVTNNIDTLAFHPYGCRVIQRILEHSPPEVTAPMLNRLMGSALKCCESQYGNYIMQYILEKGPQAEKAMLLDVLRDNFVRLSMNKFASNVTEKSTLHGTPDFRRDVVNTLCNSYHDNRPALVAMMTHSFANYVVQRLFECSDARLRQTLYDKMQGTGSEEIKKSNYGKHVMNFIDKLMEGQ